MAVVMQLRERAGSIQKKWLKMPEFLEFYSDRPRGEGLDAGD